MSVIPEVDDEECGLAGCCVNSDAGYRLALEHGVKAEHFYRPDCRRLFEACAQLWHLKGPSLPVLERRITEAARRAQVPESEVRRVVEERSLQWDTNGTLAAAVTDAALRREMMLKAAELHDRIGRGETLDQLADLLRVVR